MPHGLRQKARSRRVSDDEVRPAAAFARSAILALESVRGFTVTHVVTQHARACRSSVIACTDQICGDVAGAVADKASQDPCSGARARRLVDVPDDPKATGGLGHGIFELSALGAADGRQHSNEYLYALSLRGHNAVR